MLGLGHTKRIGLRLNDLCQITLREWPFLLTRNPVCFRLYLTLRNFKLALASDLSIERPLILNHFIFLSESLVVNFLLLHKLLALLLLFTLLLTEIELLQLTEDVALLKFLGDQSFKLFSRIGRLA